MRHDFKTNLALRQLLLTVLLGLFVWSLSRQAYVLSGISLLAAAGLFWGLLRFISHTNQALANFLESLRYNDFTTTSSSVYRGAAFGQLYESFHLVNRKLQEVRAEREANHQFLQVIVAHVKVGLLCYKPGGEVVLMNKALQALLNKPYLVNLEGLRMVDEPLYHKVKALQGGQRELLKVRLGGTLMQLAVEAAAIQLQGEWLHLVSFQNIQPELEAQELLSWKKLIRILTHEIMNSVSPIASLSSTVLNMIREEPAGPEALKQIGQSMEVIRRRSEALMDFTDNYRTLTRIPPPNLQLLEAGSLVDNVLELLQPELKAAAVEVSRKAPPYPVSFYGDPALLEQVLINLVKNAVQAMDGQPSPRQLVIGVGKKGERALLTVADNGPGIGPEMLESVFVPFFTTKPKGSGIGLPLSRQIVQLHKGSLELDSEVGKGTRAQIKI